MPWLVCSLYFQDCIALAPIMGTIMMMLTTSLFNRIYVASLSLKSIIEDLCLADTNAKARLN
jgi:hypothetical protein